MSEVGCVVGSLSGWVGLAFFARSSLMLVGTLEGVRSEVIAWFACDKASLRAQYEILFCNKELNLLLPGSGCPLHHLNDAVSSRMKTFPAISTASSWSSASSFVGF
jgi:hypothetical protein